MGGHSRDTTPALASIANSSESVWFPNCFTHARWTPESTASILTGTYPATHRVGFNDGSDPGKIPSDLSTIPDRLAKEGYRSAMVTGNGYTSSIGLQDRFDEFNLPMRDDLTSTAGVLAATDYLRDFDTYGDWDFTLDKLKRAVMPLFRLRVLKRRLKQLAASDEPFFLYSHLNNLHSPYRPPPSFLEPYADDLQMSTEEAVRFAQHANDTILDLSAHGCQFTTDEWAALKATYDAELAFTDSLVRQVFTLTRQLDLSKTIFVVTGDHGELFGERGLISHNLVLHDGLTHVPMVVNGLPGLAEHAEDIVGHTDVIRTILECAGASTDGMEGIDLRDESSDHAVTHRGPMNSMLSTLEDYNPAFDRGRFHEGELFCVRTPVFKYQRSAESSELFRLPDETVDVSAEFPNVAARLDAEINRQLAQSPSYQGINEGDFTESVQDQLQDLGYL
jgi:uncharacterized sulfatase